MAVYGLTGGIGSGKSTVCEMLTALGVAVVGADQVGRDVVAPGSEGLATLIDAFGPDVLDDAGALDRRKLGALVFSDPDKRQQLEAIIHPLVQRHSRAQFAELTENGAEIVVYESALLFESNRHLEMNGSILVTASDEIRIARVQARDNATEDEVRARMNAQTSEDEKRQIADYVIDNSGDLQSLQVQVQKLVRTLPMSP